MTRKITFYILLVITITAIAVGCYQPAPSATPTPKPLPITAEVQDFIEGRNDTDVAVPNDLGCQTYGYSPITIDLPGGGMVTNVEYSMRIATTGWLSDIGAQIEHVGFLPVWSFEGPPTAGGTVEYQDEPTDFFNGLPAAGEWRLAVRNCTMVGTATIDWWALRITYTTDALMSVKPRELYYSYSTDTESATVVELPEQHPTRAIVMTDGRQEAFAIPGVPVEYQFTSIPAYITTVDPGAMQSLNIAPGVVGVFPDMRVNASLDQARPQVRAHLAHAAGYTGEGVRVAVIDTGVDNDHPQLDDDVLDSPYQHCYLEDGGCPPNDTKESQLAEDDNGHGTSVTGNITCTDCSPATDGDQPGIAPDAEIVPIKVLGADGSGWLSDSLKAVDWIVTYNDQLNVDIINFSLGGGLFGGVCDSVYPPFAAVIAAAKDAGIATFAASGNDGSLVGMSMPACFSDVISVGAVYDASFGDLQWGGLCYDTDTYQDRVICYSNSSTRLDLLAPSWRNKTTGLDGGIERDFGGTSAASPMAAAVGALFKERYPNASPDYLRWRLKASGVPVLDHRTGRTTTRVDAWSAITDTGFYIHNTGAGDLTIEAIDQTAACWLDVEALTFPIVIAPSDSFHVGVLFDHCVGVGEYTGSITVHAAEVPDATLPVLMEVFGDAPPVPTPTDTAEPSVTPTETHTPTATPLPPCQNSYLPRVENGE